jgi:hypothetical protein
VDHPGLKEHDGLRSMDAFGHVAASMEIPVPAKMMSPFFKTTGTDRHNLFL